MKTTTRNSIVRAFCGTLLLAVAIAGAVAYTNRTHAATAWQIITWGPNTPEWNQKLGVNAMRLGCTAPPDQCVQQVSSIGPNSAKVFLSIGLDPAHAVAYGQQYGKLSPQYPSVIEVGVDDFVGVYQKLYAAHVPNPAAIVSSLIDGVKSANSHLAFGATIYEDDLKSPYLSDSYLPAVTRSKFDYVHFYIHFRADTPQTSSYLPQLKRIFPNAKVILGIYAYNRISYVPCRESGFRLCSPDDEMSYLGRGIDADILLLKAGSVSGLEFYPASFGTESDWKGWNYPRICPGRKQECVENTRKIRQMVAEKFASELRIN